MTHHAAPNQSLEELPALRVLEGLAKLHQSVFAVDAQGRVLWRSPGAGRLRGDDSFEPGQPVRDYFAHPEQLDELRARFVREGHLARVVVDLTGCDGERVPVEINAVSIPSGPGGDPILVAIARRLGEREQRDRELRETATFLSGILENSPAPVLAVDGSGFITYANPATTALLGHPLTEMLDKPVAMLATEADELEAMIAAVLSSGEVVRRDVGLRHADGGSRFVSVSTSELRLSDGRHAGSVVLLHDTTERRLVEESLRRQNGELEHYVHNVTHDLRSPLVSLLGFSRLLRQEYGEGMDDTARHFLDRIEKAGRTMETLINDLLELSRIGGARDHDSYVNVRDVLDQLRAELKPRLDSQGVRLVLPGEPTVVTCDRARLYQVFSNLIGNALDYMGPVANATIEIEIHEQPGEHRLVVRDNGRGVDPEQSERIFELFQTAGPRADGRRGTGIGLAIVKKIAQSQGGRVWVESATGGGAAFQLVLPRR